MISDEEFLLSKNPDLNLWFQPENSRFEVRDLVTAAQERLDMRSGCHAAKILPVGVRGTKIVWCLSSLITVKKNSPIIFRTSRKQRCRVNFVGTSM